MNYTKDYYSSYEELTESCKYNEDYKTEIINNNSPVSIISIHGGGIEACTTELSKEIASLGNFNYYSFMGLRNNSHESQDNLKLHITSSKFLDTQLHELLSNTLITISIHGADETQPLLYIGGLHSELITQLKLSLSKDYFIPNTIRKGLEGTSISNVCNKCISKKGVQIELSQGLRQYLFGPNWKSQRHLNNKSSKFSLNITNTINNYLNNITQQ